MAKITLGITGGIAAYKAIDLVNYLMKNGHWVNVVMTEGALKFLTPLSFVSLGAAAYVDDDEWNSSMGRGNITHIELAKADIFAVYPATANTLAKLAGGIADNLLTSAALAHAEPLVVFPAMNTQMWKARPTRHNLNYLRTHHVVGEPVEGRLACGTTGVGKLLPPKQALPFLLSELHRREDSKSDVCRPTVLVTSGGTREPVDDVRVVTNISSGMLGAMLVDKFLETGSTVIHVAPKASISPKSAAFSGHRYRFVRADSVDDMLRAIEGNVGGVDGIFHSAAISDFRFRQENAPVKLSSGSSDGFIKSMADRIEASPKILDKIRQWNSDALLVSFKFTSGKSLDDLVSIARSQLERTNSDYVLANDKAMMNAAGIHLGYLVGPEGPPTELRGKGEIVEALASLLGPNQTQGAAATNG